MFENDSSVEFIETKSIILACGGFEANKEKRIKHLGQEWENAVVRGTEFNTGDGLTMAVEVEHNKLVSMMVVMPIQLIIMLRE